MDRDPIPNNRTFVKRRLAVDEDTPSSIPLAVPIHLTYDEQTNTLHKCAHTSDSNGESYDDSGPLYTIPKSLEMLSSIDKPVAVLSICGPYRSGKSYILSRILGIQDAFGVGHTMRQNTHGIWLATTALECDDFVVVFLDTEGMDQAGASDVVKWCNFALVVLTVLISSTLIYNSMGVPKQSDLEAMSFFAQLSSMVMPDCKQQSKIDVSNQFPKFHWLLRDILLPPVDDEGEPVPLNDYIKSNILVSDSASSSTTQGVIKALLHLFPSFKCHVLPIPSNRREVLRKITENESKLSTEFNEDVHQLRLDLLNSVEPKKLLNGDDQKYINGAILCQLLELSLSSLSTPEIIPDLTCGWLAVMKNRMERFLVKYLHEYVQDIERALSDKGVIEESIPDNSENSQSPVEESLTRISEGGNESDVFERERQTTPESGRSSRLSTSRKRTTSLARSTVSSSILIPLQVTTSKTLIGIHQSILESKLKKFRQEINRCMGVVSEEEKSELLTRLERQIVQYEKTPEGNCSRRVVGGILYGYIKTNYERSKERCSQTFDHIVEPLKSNLTRRAVNSISENYYTMAVGPAKDDVYETKMAQFEELCSRLSPGPPRKLRIVGLGHNKIKMKWSRPRVHSRAVNSYEVQIVLGLKKQDRSGWKTLIPETKWKAALITDLAPSTAYLFRVRANNTNQIGEWSGEIEVITRMGKAERVRASAASFVGSSVTAPITQTTETFKQGIQAYRESETTSERVQAGVGVVVGSMLLPVILLSETLLNTTHTGVEVAEKVYKSTGTTVDDDFDETKTEVVSIAPADISSSTSSSSSGYNSIISPSPFTTDQDPPNQVVGEPLNQVEDESAENVDGHVTSTEIESESTLTPKETSIRVESTAALDSEKEQCVHYQLNVTDRDEIDADETSTHSDDTSDSVANERRPTSLDTTSANRSIERTESSSNANENTEAVTSQPRIDLPSPEENSLLCTVISFSFTDKLK